MLVTPGIFLIQIVNTNMFLIHFHCKNNVKVHFPKSWIFSFKPTTGIHYQSQRCKINLVDISKNFTIACRWNIKKTNYNYNIII